jgi:hypothetical protein
MHTSVRLSLVVGLLALSIGCGSKANLNNVTGSVSVDGKPAEGAVVMFHPTDPSIKNVASAIAGADGKFQVTYEKQTGIPVGKYKVTVIWPDPATPKPTDAERMTGLGPEAPDLLAGKYASRGTTPLEIEVTGGMKELPPLDCKK